MPGYAGAEGLPPEIIARIVELLSGQQPATWERGSNICQPLKLCKRELGNCSLVCRYWAGLLRRDIFRHIVLRSVENGRQFQSFIRSPANSELSIAKLVDRVDIHYDLSGPPWVHLVFLSLWNHSVHPDVHVAVFDSSNTSSHTRPELPRSIFHSLPRSLPLRITPRCALSLRGLRFVDISSLHKFLASVRICFRLATALAKLKLNDVRIEAPDKILIPPRRSSTLKSFTVTGGNAPLRLACSMVSTCPTWRDHPQHTVAKMEKVLFVIMQACPVVREWVLRSGEDKSRRHPEVEGAHQHLRSFACSLAGNSFKIFSWCRSESPISQIRVEFREDGTISSLYLTMKNYGQAPSFPWEQLGRDLWALDMDVELLVIGVKEERGRDALVHMISREMAQFVRAGILKFDIGKFRRHVLVDSVITGRNEHEEGKAKEEGKGGSSEHWENSDEGGVEAGGGEDGNDDEETES